MDLKSRIVGNWRVYPTNDRCNKHDITGNILNVFNVSYKVSFILNMWLTTLHDWLKLESKNSENFSVDGPQFEITGLPGTLDNLLCILGSNNILPKLVAFWYSYVKYLSSFPVILPWDFRLLNILLLLSTRSGKIVSLKITSWCIYLSPSCFSATTIQPFMP